MQIPHIQEKEIVIRDEIVKRVEEYGYPGKFIVQSIKEFEMNDASTCYYLTEKEKFSFTGSYI